MPSRKPDERLDDILKNIKLINEFTGGLDYSEFALDTKTNYAVARALEIISEASRRVPDEFKHRMRHINWKAVAGLGNRYRHDYDMVDLSIMWETISKGLPVLLEAVEQELVRLQSDQK